MSFILQEYYVEAARAHGFSGNVSMSSGYALTVDYVKQHHPEVWDSTAIRLLPAQLPGFLGGYPQNTGKEKGVDGLMIALMMLLLVFYLINFMRNKAVGHVFYPTMLVMAHCVLATIGWACRLGWSNDIANFHLGLASYFLITVTEYLLPLCNFCFAVRMYSFIHPGDVKLSRFHFIGPIAGFVSFIMCIVGPCVQFFTYASAGTVSSLQQVQLAGGILGVIYHLAPIGLTIACFLTSTKGPDKVNEVVVLQPYWITEFSLFARYAPQNGSEFANKAVIPMRSSPGRDKFVLDNPPMTHGPQLWTAILIYIPSAFLLWSSALMRTLSIGFANNGYTAEYVTNSNPLKLTSVWFPSSVEALWVFYGGIQTLTLLLWIITRVDLRFYVPSGKVHPRDDGYQLEHLEDDG